MTSASAGSFAVLSSAAVRLARFIWLNSADHTEEHAAFRGNVVYTTKYNLATFLPKALFEQYRRLANMYFTLVAAISTTSISPVSPVTTFLPLIIVLGISIVKEAIEDFGRYRADREVNNRKVAVFSPAEGRFIDKAWKLVQVGEIVRCEKDAFFAADMVLLTSSNPEGVCYVETINLDGESNLKIKQALDETRDMSEEALPTFKGTLECELPNASLYTFTGNLRLEQPGQDPAAQATLPLSQASVLLRGCSLRNTGRILGAVIFAGHESKVMMNARQPPSKRSRIERQMDKLILGMFILLFLMCVIGASCFTVWTRAAGNTMWYLRPENTAAAFDPRKPAALWLLSFVTSFVLYGYLIPISLYVSLEMVKVVQSMVLINQDRAMYHAASDTPAKARTSNLNEELGMVDTILSDKTGTLTCNMMEFFKCSIAGVDYGRGVTEIEKSNARRLKQQLPDMDEDPAAAQWREKAFNFFDKRMMASAWTAETNPAIVEEFLRALAVCHTVIPDGPEEPKLIRYQAESPDESALVAAAKVLGFFFHRRTSTTIFVQEQVGHKLTEVEYEILNILEFDSTRKRMSVICRTPDNRILLYCKGADTVIYERLDLQHPVNKELREVTRAHMEEFGAGGLRTLCLSYAELDHEEYDRWQQEWVEAKTAMQGREAKVAAVAEGIERRLVLLGCTAIEDKLQEGVPEAIEHLAQAGIALWVLTGDKQETAINIAFACSLLRSDMTQYIVNVDCPEVAVLEDAGRKEDAFKVAHSRAVQQLQDVLRFMAEAAGKGPDNALIIDGKALTHALAPDVKALLLEVGAQCAAVVCCRVSPKQKAQVTALVKTRGDTTLGIGDGANDVGMIQEAHIGVGISGQEGMQAVMSSDFAIAQFRFLEPLLLVHGRRSYLRISRMVNYFLYKNLLFGLTIFFFNGMCLFSGQILYNDFYMSGYNVAFSLLPPLLIGIMDQDVDRGHASKYPGLYQVGPQNRNFNRRAISWWLLNAALQAGIMFAMVIVGCYNTNIDRASGHTFTHWEVGSILFTIVVFTVHLEIASVLEYWTWIHHVCIWCSAAFWIMYLIVYGALPLKWSSHIYHLFDDVLAPAPHFWLIILVTPIACILPGFFVRQTLKPLWPHDSRQLRPDDSRIVMELQQAGALSKRKRRRVEEEELQPLPSPPRMVRASSSMLRVKGGVANLGFVPGDAPGADSYFTPAANVEAGNASLNKQRSAQRCSVINALDGALLTHPMRHRTSSMKLHKSVSFNNPTSQLSNGSIAAEAGRMTGDSEKDMLRRSLSPIPRRSDKFSLAASSIPEK